MSIRKPGRDAISGNGTYSNAEFYIEKPLSKLLAIIKRVKLDEVL